MRYAVSVNRIREVPHDYSIGFGDDMSYFGINTPTETMIAEVQIVEADTPIAALNKVLTCCPQFSEENDIEGLVKWLGLIKIIVSVPVPLDLE